MNNNYRNKNISFSVFVIIALISFSLPFLISTLIKKDSKTSELPTQFTQLQHQQNDANEQLFIKMMGMIKEIKEIKNEINKPQPSIPLPEPEPAPMMTLDDRELEVVWLDSPVLQKWQLDPKTGLWHTALPYKDSFRSNPTIVIGLREDGVLTWKRVNPSK